MAIDFGANDGQSNGTTAVTLVAAPTTGQRVVRDICIHNRDTVSHTVTIIYLSGVNQRYRIREPLVAGASFTFGEKGEVIVLDATTKSLQFKLDAAHTTMPCDFSCGWADET